MSTVLYLVIPCYNEQEVIYETARLLDNMYNDLMKADRIEASSRIVFVNDGSSDATWEHISELHQNNPRFLGISLSRNYGHQYALMAGLTYSRNKADAVITIDADLQDDINAILPMLDSYQAGCEVVYGVRNNRDSDSYLKRVTAEMFYKFMKLMGTDTVYNHADFRLMSRKAIKALMKYEEVNLYLRGVIPLIGFKTDTIYYTRNIRFAGKTKYSPRKMLNLAWEGITSFSMKPMRFISFLGVSIFSLSILVSIYILIRHITGHTVIGWTSVALSVWMTGGLLLFSMGVIGEYIGKIYMETKRRPRYFIETIIDDDKDNVDKLIHD